MKITIEGKELKTVADFHKTIKLLLNLPDYYGENLDALWDCLTGWMQMPLSVVWKDFDQSKIYLNEFADEAFRLFKEAEKELVGFKITKSRTKLNMH